MRFTILLYLSQPGDQQSSLLSWEFFQERSDKSSEQEAKHTTGAGSFLEFISFYKNFLENMSGRRKAIKPVLIGLLPGNTLTYANISIPTNNKQQMLQALPFAVEEFVIGDIYAMQIGIGSLDQDGLVRVSVAEKKLIERWLNLFSNAGLILNAIIGLPDLLPAFEKEASIAFFDKFVLFKSNKQCLQFYRDGFDSAFSIIEFNRIEKLNVFYIKTDKEAISAAKKIKIEFESGGGEHAELKEFSGDVFDFFECENNDFLYDKIDFISNKNIRMATGIFNPAFWIPVSIAAALLVIIQIGLNVGSGFYFKRKANIELINAQSRYKSLFPDEEITDIYSQWEIKLKSSSTNSRENLFSFVFPAVIDEFNKQKKAGVSEFKLIQFRFDKEDGGLKIDIDVKSVAILDSVKKALMQRGLQMEILSANEENNLIRAAILVKSS